MLNVVERTDVLRCALEYNTDLFDASTAARMAEHLGVLLAAIVAEPDRAVADAAGALRPRARTCCFEEWNDTAVDIDTDSTLAAPLRGTGRPVPRRAGSRRRGRRRRPASKRSA